MSGDIQTLTLSIPPRILKRLQKTWKDLLWSDRKSYWRWCEELELITYYRNAKADANLLNRKKISIAKWTWPTSNCSLQIKKKIETQIKKEIIYSQGIGMEFGEKCVMLIMKSWKQLMTEGTELPNHEKIRSSEKRKPTNTWEYWKWTPSNKWRWRKILEKSISGERVNYSKANCIVEISLKS